MIAQGQPGGRRSYSHGHAWLDLKPGIDSQEVHVVLRRGATVKGRVVGPDGQPVRDAWIISRIILESETRAGGGAGTAAIMATCASGRFEIHGLDPETEIPVYFLDPKRKLGGVVNLSGKSAARRRSPSGSSPAAPPGRGWSIPTASRSRDDCPGGS